MSAKPDARPGDLPFASLLSAAYGSAAIALFFLAIDTVRGEPFFTPSLMGSVVLLGIPAQEVASIRFDAMAMYTVVHLLAFLGLGAVATLAYARVRAIPRGSFVLGALILGGLTIGTIGVDVLLFPGIIDRIGDLPLAAGNLVASIAMSTMIVSTFRKSEQSEVESFGTMEPESVRV